MQSLLLLFASMVALAAPASERWKATLEAMPTCANFVRFDDQNLYLGFGAYKRGFEEPRSPIPSRFRVAPLSGGGWRDFATDDSTIDVATEGDRAFVLTFSAIEEWDLASGTRIAKHQTYFFEPVMEYREHARAFARYKNKLILAHGRLGVSFFDMNTKRITNQYKLAKNRAPLESQAMSVVMVGKYAYVLLDGFTLVPQGEPKQPLRGLVVVDMDSEKVVRELDGLDPGADALATDGVKLIVSFMGMPVWKYDLAALGGARLPAPEQMVWRFPSAGHPTGSPVIDDKFYYTCFMKRPEPPARGDAKLVPLALDRRALMLD